MTKKSHAYAFPIAKFPYSIVKNNGNIRDAGNGGFVVFTGANGATAVGDIRVSADPTATFTDLPHHFYAASNLLSVDTGSNVVSGRSVFYVTLGDRSFSAKLSVEFVPAPIPTWDIPYLSTSYMHISRARGVSVSSTWTLSTSYPSIDLSRFVTYCPQNYATDASSSSYTTTGSGAGASVSSNHSLVIDRTTTTPVPFVVRAVDARGNVATVDMLVCSVAHPIPSPTPTPVPAPWVAPPPTPLPFLVLDYELVSNAAIDDATKVITLGTGSAGARAVGRLTMNQACSFSTLPPYFGADASGSNLTIDTLYRATSGAWDFYATPRDNDYALQPPLKFTAKFVATEAPVWSIPASASLSSAYGPVVSSYLTTRVASSSTTNVELSKLVLEYNPWMRFTIVAAPDGAAEIVRKTLLPISDTSPNHTVLRVHHSNLTSTGSNVIVVRVTTEQGNVASLTLTPVAAPPVPFATPPPAALLSSQLAMPVGGYTLTTSNSIANMVDLGKGALIIYTGSSGATAVGALTMHQPVSFAQLPPFFTADASGSNLVIDTSSNVVSGQWRLSATNASLQFTVDFVATASPAWSVPLTSALTPAFGRDAETHLTFTPGSQEQRSFDLMKLIHQHGSGSGSAVRFTMDGAAALATLSNNVLVVHNVAVPLVGDSGVVTLYATSERGNVAKLTMRWPRSSPT